MKKRTWQRMTLSLVGIAIVAANWRWSVFHLYSLPEHSIAAFTSITNNSQYSISAIVIFMVTGRLVYDWKNETSSKIIERGEQLIGKRPKDVDDGSID